MRRSTQAGDTYAIVQHILRRGNEPGLFAEWFAGMKSWADVNGGQDAAALRTWLGIAPPKPFYTADELAYLWPALKIALGLRKSLELRPSAYRLANELEFHGLPLLKNANGTMTFQRPGLDPAKFFIVEHVHRWKGRAITQQEFDDVYHG